MSWPTSQDPIIAAYAGPGEKRSLALVFDEFIEHACSRELVQALRECRDRVIAEAVKEGEQAVRVDVRRDYVGDPAISIYTLEVEGNGGRRKITCGSREQLDALINGMKAICRMFNIYMVEPEIP